MPTPEKYSFNEAVIWKGIRCHITSRRGQPSSAYQTKHKFYAPGTYYNLREQKSGKQHIDIHHRDLIPAHVAMEHDRDRLVMERAD